LEDFTNIALNLKGGATVIYTNIDIINVFNRNLLEAQNELRQLKFRATNSAPNFKALGGWVFEETICDCFSKEFKNLPINRVLEFQINEQFKLSNFKTGSRGVCDYRISNDDKHILLEVKSSGLNSPKNFVTYKANHGIIKEQVGYEYLYITGCETSKPYKQETQNIFGVENSFFLDTDTDAWEKFVQRVYDILI
jgi:hypothetical protein